MATIDNRPGERILILAPVGRDARLAARALGAAGLANHVCSDINELSQELEVGAGTLLLTQEALAREAVERLLSALSRQPPWSDLPIIVLLGGGPTNRVVNTLFGVFDERANVTFLERPVRTAMLVRSVKVALRARHRQYEIAELLQLRAMAEGAERQARTAAEEAVRTRDEFLASVAHDLKNPLGSIKGFAQLLQRQAKRVGTPETDRLAQGLARIDTMAIKMVSQIDELLDLARLQSDQSLPLEPRPTDLVELVQRVVAEYTSVSLPDRLRIEIAEPEVTGVWDPARLERVLGNLLSNAIKYSPPDTTVTVNVTCEDSRGQYWARVTVQDRGIGIPVADLPRLFQRFFRASNVIGRAPGSGLGLAGARQIVEQHGGTLTVRSEEGCGSAFTVRLPIWNDPLDRYPPTDSE